MKNFTHPNKQKTSWPVTFKGYKGEPRKYISQKNIILKIHLTMICISLLSKRTKNLLVWVSLQP